MANNPALLRAVANPTPYLGAPANPMAATPTAAAGKPSPEAKPADGDAPAHPLTELHGRMHAIRDQATELAKNLGYLTSDASLHEDVPGRVETKLGKAGDALGEVMSLIEAVCEDLDETMGEDDDEGETA